MQGKNLTNTTCINRNRDLIFDSKLGPQDCYAETLEVKDAPERDISSPRTVVQTTFWNTPRLFKTPSRVSTVKQEQYFMIKNRCNLKKNALLNDIGIGGADPVWLTAKGDEFCSKGDFCSAINAYMEALRKDNSLVQALVKRAACYLHLREGAFCVKDCLAALQMNEIIDDQFNTPREQAQFRKDTHIRSTLAHCLIEDLATGILIESICYFSAFMEATQFKVDADNNFAKGNFMKASELNSKALAVDPTHLKALINRAACHLGLKNPSDCIDDCNHALNECKNIIYLPQFYFPNTTCKGSGLSRCCAIVLLTKKSKWITKEVSQIWKRH